MIGQNVSNAAWFTLTSFKINRTCADIPTKNTNSEGRRNKMPLELGTKASFFLGGEKVPGWGKLGDSKIVLTLSHEPRTLKSPLPKTVVRFYWNWKYVVLKINFEGKGIVRFPKKFQ